MISKLSIWSEEKKISIYPKKNWSKIDIWSQKMFGPKTNVPIFSKNFSEQNLSEKKIASTNFETKEKKPKRFEEKDFCLKSFGSK